MEESAPDLRPKKLQPRLRAVTERLAHELSKTSLHPPAWSQTDWQLARAVASMQGISGLLATRLRWKGPVGWQRFLHEQKAHIEQRHERIQALLRRIDARGRELGVGMVGLKGTELHARGYYLPGDRPMADIDLLVPLRNSQAAIHTLESLGFQEAYESWKHKVFTEPHSATAAGLGEHADNPLKIELHTRIAEALPLRATEITSQILSVEPREGLDGYRSAGALAAHLLLHAAGAMAFRAIRNMHLHDIALVAERMSRADWLEIAHCGAGCWWALPPLTLAAKYYELNVPSDVLNEMSNQCGWLLRDGVRKYTFSDVSLTYLWVEAFPGIRWCRSWNEAIEYIRSRVLPNNEVRRLRSVLAETQISYSRDDWARLSQPRRMLRWLTSRPTRPESCHSVRFVLEGNAGAVR